MTTDELYAEVETVRRSDKMADIVATQLEQWAAQTDSVQFPHPKRWGGSIHSIPRIADLFRKKLYMPTDFYTDILGRCYLTVIGFGEIEAAGIPELERMAEALDWNEDAPGFLFRYRDILDDTHTVELIEYNHVENWHIKTAQVRFRDGKVKHVGCKRLEPTGERADPEAHHAGPQRPALIFGQKRPTAKEWKAGRK